MTQPAPFDVDAARAQFPALAEGLAHFDGPGGTQVPEAVSDAMTAALRSALSNRHGPFASSARSDAHVDAARAAVADLVGGDPRGVFFGASSTANAYVLASALAKTWGPGDEVVVSRLDHDSNIRPWVQAAARAGATVRWAEVDVATTELPVEQYDALLSERTRFVALTAASNATGTRPDVRAVAQQAHAVGALVHVDGVHATPHAAVDLRVQGADSWATSAYKWYGPHVGATVADPALLETLHPDKLLASTEDVPDRFELGTPAFAQLAGVAAAVDWLATWGDGTTRRERVTSGVASIARHEHALWHRLKSALEERDDVTLVGSPASSTPTLAFTVAGRTPQQVATDLGARGVCVWAGHYYALELMQALGLPDGAVRAGIACYTTDDDVDRLLAAL
ncbi:MAG: hypothetical protein JWM64_789 [Frankiales bacterium]|nr:hypothetical protein [Frankiales bacterium]